MEQRSDLCHFGTVEPHRRGEDFLHLPLGKTRGTHWEFGRASGLSFVTQPLRCSYWTGRLGLGRTGAWLVVIHGPMLLVDNIVNRSSLSTDHAVTRGGFWEGCEEA